MTTRPSLRSVCVPTLTRSLGVGLLSVWGLLACGGDDVQTGGPIGPSGVVELSIAGFLNDRGERFDDDAERATLSCDGRISVLFEAANDGTLENWLLRPPGACQSFAQCGYVALSATREGGSTVSTAGASTTLILDLAPGTYRFEAKLMNGDGEEYLQDAMPVSASVESIELVAQGSCDTSSTSTSQGTGGASTTATSTGGTGGSGTVTGTDAGGAAGAGGVSEGGAAGSAGAGGQDS